MNIQENGARFLADARIGHHVVYRRFGSGRKFRGQVSWVESTHFEVMPRGSVTAHYLPRKDIAGPENPCGSVLIEYFATTTQEDIDR